MELKGVTEVSQNSTRLQTTLRNFAGKLPTGITPAIKRLAVGSLIGQGVLIVSGGVVRVTGSGLGCPTWPKCTAESLTNTAEMGIHGFIEFANRTLTFALAAVGLALLVLLWNLRKERKDLFWLAFGLLAVIPAQAVIGGITVLTGLNPFVVSLHFLGFGRAGRCVHAARQPGLRQDGHDGAHQPCAPRPPGPAAQCCRRSRELPGGCARHAGDRVRTALG